MWWKELLFTGFYSGYCFIAPGTAATILAAIIYIIEFTIFRENIFIFNAIVVMIMIYPSIKLGDEAEKFFKRKDPRQVVLDEMMGFWVSVLFFPFNCKIVILAFILFRINDIIKPYPIKKMENFRGGYGIMMDDFISGIYSNLMIRIINVIVGMAGFNIY